MLFQDAQHGVGPRHDFPLIGGLQAADDPQQRGLAGAVGADRRRAFAAPQFKAGAAEHRFGPKMLYNPTDAQFHHDFDSLS